MKFFGIMTVFTACGSQQGSSARKPPATYIGSNEGHLRSDRVHHLIIDSQLDCHRLSLDTRSTDTYSRQHCVGCSAFLCHHRVFASAAVERALVVEHVIYLLETPRFLPAVE
jgi:hypothetical protein